MFETQLANLFENLKTVTDLAIVSYEGFVLEQYPKSESEGAASRLSLLTPLIQQMKTGFRLMGLGEVSSLSLEGPNRKLVCWPINDTYLLVAALDVDEHDGRVSFELSTAAAQIIGYFH
jgi:predicted regulator of Ras-like GTPase activity (Roadblock/LC7/MglB family)